MSGTSEIRPGALFASDYRVERVLRAEAPGRCLVAVNPGGQRVRIVELSTGQSLLWATAAVEHPALSVLVETLTVLDSSFGVYEDIAGVDAATQLAATGPLGAVEAVRATLRVAQGLTVLHRAGLVHGAIGPDCLILQPELGGGAVLVFGTASAPRPGYRAPDRSAAPLAPEDDLWATGALLHEMLTGTPPPETGVSAHEQLEDAGIEEDVLGGIVAQALAADPNRRSARIASMRHPLQFWLDRHGRQPEAASTGRHYAWSRAVLPSSHPPPPRDSDAPELEVDDGHLSEPPAKPAAGRRDSDAPALEVGEGHLSEPPPTGNDAVPPPSGSAVPPPSGSVAVSPPGDAGPRESAPGGGVTRESPRASSGARIGLVAAAAIVLCGAGVLLLRHHGGALHRGAATASAAKAQARTPVPHRRPLPVRPSAPLPASAAAPASATAQATASAAPADESVQACVARHLPAFSFEKTPDMGWLCKTADPRPGAQHLHRDIVKAAGGQITPAMQLFSPLTWYGMAEFAAVRGACCPDAAPLELPSPSNGCQSIAMALTDLGTDVSEGKNPMKQLQAFSAGVGCELQHHRQLAYWEKDRPGGGEAHDFEKLLESAMHPRKSP